MVISFFLWDVAAITTDEVHKKTPGPSGPGVEMKRAGVGSGPMMIGDSAVRAAAADRHGTESAAAAAAWLICLSTTVAFRLGK
jgi:hypothetical protein